MNLTDEDVQEIIRLLDSSFFGELHVRTADFDLHLRRSGAGWTRETQTLTPPRVVAGETAAPSASPSANGTAPAEPVGDEAVEEGMALVRSPMVGTFYHAPKPGAPPFVWSSRPRFL